MGWIQSLLRRDIYSRMARLYRLGQPDTKRIARLRAFGMSQRQIANNLGLKPVILTVNAASQHHGILGDFASVRFAACQKRRRADSFALLFPRIREKGIRPSFERFDASMFRVQKRGNRLVQSCFVPFARREQ